MQWLGLGLVSVVTDQPAKAHSLSHRVTESVHHPVPSLSQHLVHDVRSPDWTQTGHLQWNVFTPEWKLGYYQAAHHRKLLWRQFRHKHNWITLIGWYMLFWGELCFCSTLSVTGCQAGCAASRSDSQPASLLAVKLLNQTNSHAAGVLWDFEIQTSLIFCSVTPMFQKHENNQILYQTVDTPLQQLEVQLYFPPFLNFGHPIGAPSDSRRCGASVF